ncbi:MAG: LytTR family transcriptional regulator DNA-binding domain-containing protein [Holophagaceae bacterium]|nr:LytTR family transcriptional regulator DNA-binding domain-containing protein [Holophagaceae bacterium]
MTEKVFSAVAVDDEELARAVIREHLAAHSDFYLLAECANGFDAVKTVNELKPDLLFLDVQMPKLDGFEVLELLDVSPATIFVTAYDQHALRAFEVHAVDYLLKPFGRTRFDDAIAQARALLRQGSPKKIQAAELSHAAKPDWPMDRIVVKDGPKVTLIPLADLEYIQAQDDYVLLKTQEKGHLKQQTLSSLEKRLDSGRFLRIHRSFIVQLDRLARLEQKDTESWVAVLTGGARLPVSKSGYAKLKEKIGPAAWGKVKERSE